MSKKQPTPAQAIRTLVAHVDSLTDQEYRQLAKLPDSRKGIERTLANVQNQIATFDPLIGELKRVEAKLALALASGGRMLA